MFFRTESFQQFIRYYPIVTAIILIHVLLYLVTTLPFFPGDYIFSILAGVNLYISEGELWRFITPTFLHSGFAHMLFNSFSLVLFGPGLERLLGKTKFLMLYLAGGILANIATYFVNPLYYTHVGSSGAIFALFGFYIAIIVYRKHMLSQQNSQIILTITVIGVIMTFIQPNINISAHVFGLIAGFMIGSIAYYDRHSKPSFGMRTSGGQMRLGKFSFAKIRLGSASKGKLIIWGIIAILAVLGFFSRF
ncbi:rhomboid family intramembrane serine protease [Bacillus sp. DNRA2]|uniref:rhomboid family intramembrane serine protease n=1 Tax=Bacillus sp. DNRA2 TaxID=2723053 RepID=UPI00145ECD09|nr:rhomboid family intramembrane serine protease [Bacillus sp. DNRA2]NMD72552.1 rhomboid family intramembrane serine protease [Bacillus sp. DNRA2]